MPQLGWSVGLAHLWGATCVKDAFCWPVVLLHWHALSTQAPSTSTRTRACQLDANGTCLLMSLHCKSSCAAPAAHCQCLRHCTWEYSPDPTALVTDCPLVLIPLVPSGLLQELAWCDCWSAPAPCCS
jgi:hypothetical protein